MITASNNAMRMMHRTTIEGMTMTKFDARITLSLILEEAVDTYMGPGIKRIVRNLTPEQIDEVIAIAPLDKDAMTTLLK
jgi:hypothetical protein